MVVHAGVCSKTYAVGRVLYERRLPAWDGDSISAGGEQCSKTYLSLRGAKGWNSEGGAATFNLDNPGIAVKVQRPVWGEWNRSLMRDGFHWRLSLPFRERFNNVGASLSWSWANYYLPQILDDFGTHVHSQQIWHTSIWKPANIAGG